MWISDLTVAEQLTDELVTVQDIVRDVTPESPKNFLQSDLVCIKTQSVKHLPAFHLASDIVIQKKAQNENDKTLSGFG